MFDALIREAASRYGLGEQAIPLLRWLLRYVFQETPGGLAGFIDLFRKAGLGDVASSWIGGVSPKEIAPERVESVLGTDALGRLAAAVGLGRSVVLPAAAYLLPRVVNLLTRDGIPSGIPAAVAGYLAEPGHAIRREQEEPGPMRWLTWLLLPILALLLWRWCTPPPAPVGTPPPLPVAVATPAAEALPAVVYFALAEQTLDAEEQAKLAAVAEYLNANPGAKIAITGYADRSGTRETNEEIAKERAKSVRESLEAAGIREERIVMKPPLFTTGSGSDPEARRVEIRESEEGT